MVHCELEGQDLMAGAGYERLVTWSNQGHGLIKVERPDTRESHNWTVRLSIQDPVIFSAYGRGSTVDDAAAQVIEQLRTVGVEIP